MGKPTPPEPVALFIGLLWAEPGGDEEALNQLVPRYGACRWLSPVIPWTWSRYYCEELGEPVLRRFCTLGEPRSPEELPALKHACNALEQELARDDGRRRVNIDPGLLSLHSLVLASTKPHAHRIAIGQGLYAEVTLLFHHGQFQPLPWTYPDYAASAALLTEPRAQLKAILRRKPDTAP